MERIPTKPECQCSCDDPYKKANQLISDFVLNDIEDPDMDIDDNEELEKLQKPYKCECFPYLCYNFKTKEIPQN